mmetsp:Transcript_8257/g.9557  ORF Transcript_8257/g.9557 Transcript_8257/m.9557 type:complete len:410 (+) Transcript_8257:739-1968(+)
MHTIHHIYRSFFWYIPKERYSSCQYIIIMKFSLACLIVVLAPVFASVISDNNMNTVVVDTDGEVRVDVDVDVEDEFDVDIVVNKEEVAGTTMTVTAETAETKLPGIYGPESKSKVTIDVASINPKNFTNTKSIPATILDARAKERKEGLSKSEFFNKYGFVILDHKTSMVAEDWLASDREVTIAELIKNNFYDLGDQYQKVMDRYQNSHTPAKHIYANEVEGLIRTTFPQTKEVMAPAQGVRRTVSSNSNKPVKSMHTDYGFSSFDGLFENIKFIDFHPYHSKYEETGANELMLVNFWRPVSMHQSLRSNPLCFLDSSTVDIKDFVTIEYQADEKKVFNSYTIKENPSHEFYFYPDMTNDEVVMFKQFHQMRNESTARIPTFHTAFADPAADEETEARISFEYRVAILF